MKKSLMITIIIILSLSYVTSVFLFNRYYRLRDKPLAFKNHQAAQVTTPKLKLVTWNLGYGGLGEESDFVTDGGTHMLPPSRRIVKKNIEGINSTIQSIDADVFAFQEVTRISPMNYWVNLKTDLDRVLTHYTAIYRPEILSRMVPAPIRINYGKAFYVKPRISSLRNRPLPLEPINYFGFIKRLYSALVIHIPIQGRDKEWVIFNIHLSAFDKNGNVRMKQLRAVIDMAREEYKAGNYVILAGDWNMVLHQPKNSYTTENRFLFWLIKFPDMILPPDWQIVTSKDIPSVRTLERPYKAAENFTTIIDGFILSPNVGWTSVNAVDTRFRDTDHQPVILEATARPS